MNPGVKRETANSILKHLAEGTGGTYITTEDDLSKAAKQLMQDMTTYYEASYVPAIEEYDGSFRAIAVKPLRAGLTIRTQAGYLALPARADATLQPFELPLVKILSDPKLPTDVNFRTSILHMEDVPEGSVNSLSCRNPTLKSRPSRGLRHGPVCSARVDGCRHQRQDGLGRRPLQRGCSLERRTEQY